MADKVHSSFTTQGERIIFLAGPSVSPTKGDKQSESLVRVARGATIECGGCAGRFPAPAFEGNSVCASCFDEAGIENEHSDGYHDEAPEPQCVQCFPHGY